MAAENPPARGHTKFGSFVGYKCTNSVPQPMTTFFFFSCYVVVTAWVVLSLFIGVMSIGMFQAFEDIKKEMREINYRMRLEKNAATETVEEEEEEKKKKKKKKKKVNPNSLATEELSLKELIDYALTADVGEYKAETSFEETVLALQKRAIRIQDSALFQTTIVSMILLVSVVIGIDTDHAVSCELRSARTCQGPPIVKVVDTLSQALFTLEAAVKIMSHGMTPKNYFKDRKDGSWNSLDFFVVCVGFAELTPAKVIFAVFPVVVLRLLRLLRVFRLAKGKEALYFIFALNRRSSIHSS